LWGGIAVASGVTALIGYFALDGVSPALIAVITATAAGAILADTMAPEACESSRPHRPNHRRRLPHRTRGPPGWRMSPTRPQLCRS
jgi:zinc transporter ZupT